MTHKQTTAEIETVITDAAATGRAIEIISGEGEQGTVERYTGAPSVKAIKARLTRERSNGDRWARVQVSAAE